MDGSTKHRTNSSDCCELGFAEAKCTSCRNKYEVSRSGIVDGTPGRAAVH